MAVCFLCGGGKGPQTRGGRKGPQTRGRTAASFHRPHPLYPSTAGDWTNVAAPAAATLSASFLAIPDGAGNPGLPTVRWGLVSAVAASVVLIVLPCAVLARWLLRSRILSWLSSISYSAYLFH